MTDEHFDQLLRDMRDESATPAEIASARDRVWQRLQVPPACGEFRAEFAVYLAGGLAESRRMLLDDHLARCSDCRRALLTFKGETRTVPRPVARAASYPWTRWAIAAGVLLCGLYLGSDSIDAALAPRGPRATVASVSGEVDRLPQGALQVGATLSDGEFVRTATGARAVLRLADGSQVEMNQRTELAVTAAWSGQTVRLERGDVVVEAAKQRRGHLRVMTRDSVASVKGTVFGVSSGTAGSVVSVIEGSVAVSQPGAEHLLTKGQHAATNAALDQVDVRRTIAWSNDAQKYYAVLGELADIEKQVAGLPAPRTEARLLRSLPDGVHMYFAIPNLSGSIRQAMFQLAQRARENEVLNDWWTSATGEQVRNTLDHMQSITPLLGDEVVFVWSTDAAQHSAPLVLAEVQPGREDALRQALSRLTPNQESDAGNSPPYRVADNLLLISDTAAHVNALSGRLGRGTRPEFMAEIGRRYQRGVGWLAAIDLTGLPPALRQSIGARTTGFSNARFLFFEQGLGGRPDDNEATLSFAGTRTGIASWLAPVGAAGSSDYVSASAVAVFSAATRDPRQAFDELLSTLGEDSGFVTGLRQFEADSGVSVGADIASSLGTDFTFAIEHPTIPIPGWVAAFEVVRPGVLDDTIRRLVDAFNGRLTPETASRRVALTQNVVNGRTWSSMTRADGAMGGMALYWTYDRGYMVVSTDRAVAASAIAARESGSSLVRSAAFLERFPVSGGVHHSGFVWLNPSGAVADLAGLVQNPALKSMLASREPMLIVIDGDTEQIHAASRTRLTSLMLNAVLVQHADAVAPGDSAPKTLHQLK